MFGLDFAKLLRPPAPRWDWLQVEITSHCNGFCNYCPRTVYGDEWSSRHLPLESFRKLASAFANTRHAHLQGWGEPFLHPDFFEMVSIAKKAGCRVGTTTNGTLLDRALIRRLLASRIDIIAFSLAGGTDENDRIRSGTRLDQVIEAMQALQDEKRREQTETPVVHVAYMLLKSGMRSLQELPGRLAGYGVSDVVISFLDCVPCAELQAEVIAPASKAEQAELQSSLEEIKRIGAEHQINIHHPLESAGDPEHGCTENVLRAAFIGSDGSVSPCVLANLPLREDQAPPAASGQRLYQRMVFGNIAEKPLDEIWRNDAYAAFRNSFREGKLFSSCMHCPKLARP